MLSHRTIRRVNLSGSSRGRRRSPSRVLPPRRDRKSSSTLWTRGPAPQLSPYRRHLGARMRSAGQEIALHRGPIPQASSASLAEMLLGRLTSPTQAAQRAEVRLLLQEALNGMDPLDREVLTLRHFEELSNAEVA